MIIDVSFKNSTGTKYKPFWKKCICAGRAAEGLRDDWRMQLREVQKEIGFEYIRFHGIYHDDMMIYSETTEGTPVYNWQYLDNLFDFFMEVNIRPLLELSFMPSALASGEGTGFWWKANMTPPKDSSKWAELIKNTIVHCINRYGSKEVSSWYFEFWNEPNLINGFWFSTQEEYYKLYTVTTQAIKSIDSGLRVGGPATAHCNWLTDFLTYCDKNSVAVDFVSTHPYPNSWPLDGYGNYIMEYKDENSTYDDLKAIKENVICSAYPEAEIHLTEWNSSSTPRDLVHDTAFMASFIVKNNIQCIGLADSLGFWTFTDIFEENRAGDDIFHGGFGLINAQGLKKPAYYGYWFLSRLGDICLSKGDGFFVCKKGDKIQVLLWNYSHYTESFAKADRSALSYYNRYDVFQKNDDMIYDLKFDDLSSNSYKMTTYSLGRDKGSVFDIWLENGALPNPSCEEVEILKKKSGPIVSIRRYNSSEKIECQMVLKPHEVVFVELLPIYGQQ